MSMSTTTVTGSPAPGSPSRGRRKPRSRMRRWVAAGGVLLAMFVALVVAGALLPESPDQLAGSITNARPAGVRALGQVLAADGVDVTQVTTLDEASRAGAGSTLAVYLTTELSSDALARLQAVPADMVILYAGTAELESVSALTQGHIIADYWWTESSSDKGVRADCDDPDALAAGTITAPRTYGVWTDGFDAPVCFPGDEEDVGAYATVTTPWHRVDVVAGDRWLRNDTITQDGNAALALRVLGRHSSLVWYLPGSDAMPKEQHDASTLDEFSLLPPWSRTALAALLLAGAAAALWRGRRFGPLVKEFLPVEVPASEAASGLARLYRQAGAAGHAAAGLRAATLHRAAPRLGLPPSASAEVVIERLAQASGYPPERIRALCYGPPPATDAELVALATDLSDLERKLTSRE